MEEVTIDHNVSPTNESLAVVENGAIAQHTEARRNRIALLLRDAVIIIAFCITAAAGSWELSRRIDPVIFEIGSLNIWFDADIPRIFVDMNYRDSELYTTKRHPLVPLMEYPPVYLLKRLMGLDPVTAVHVTVAALAALWAGLFFIVLRLVGCRRIDALVFTLLALVSSSAMFWLVVPETLPFGSVTILGALGLVALAQRRSIPPAWYVLASAATLSATVTNWMFGVLATAVKHPFRRTVQITVNAFCLVTLLWVVQKIIFPGSSFFLGSSDADIPDMESGGAFPMLRSFFFHSIVMPAISTTHWFYNPNLTVMTVQPSSPGSAGLAGALAAAAWSALMALGLWTLFSMKTSGRLRAFIGLGLIGQISLHLLFGREGFFYAIHYQPLLVVMVALVVFTSARIPGIVIALVVIVFGGFNNFQQLGKAIDFVHSEATQAHAMEVAIRARANDPWPRGTQNLKSARIGRLLPDVPDSLDKGGHIILGWPGTHTNDKAYFEPGGNFSPAVSSFGVSIWLRDAKDRVETSETIPLHLLRQQFVWDESNPVPGVRSETPYYRALWSSSKPGVWLLKLTPGANVKPAIVIRSVGPAGGPIQLLEWNDRQLVINSRWAVELNARPVAVQLGEEGLKGWMTGQSNAKRWGGNNGWGFAKFELKDGQDYEMMITDLKQTSAPERSFAEMRSRLRVQLPDERFAASMQAQISHLLMGIVGDEARPGDPMSYPFAWLRDEAYVIAALARSGQLATAKELSTRLAESDFFGGFGAEADAPGLAIWALTDLAKQLNDRNYDHWLWPHIRRKAEFIKRLLSSDRPVYEQVVTPVIPLYIKPLPSADPDVTLVADPTRDGLIMGRINESRAPLYVSSVSYRGLIDAAALADRIGQSASAREWRRHAAELRDAWWKIMDTTPSADRFTTARMLWPTQMASSRSSGAINMLETSWAANSLTGLEPFSKSPTIKIGEAHQWLLLGRGDRAWSTLAAYWDHQEAPGLYTWSVESTRENTYNSWKRVRGWLKGQDRVTPSYNVAAEVLLLQLDMLAYSDEAADEATVVIGAGVQHSWLESPMHAEEISTRIGRVDWVWNGRQMNVKIYGSHARVRLGPAFAPDTPVNVEYMS